MSQNCGGYTGFKNPDETGNKILIENYENLTKILRDINFPNLKDLTLEKLLDNYIYATQIVAGKNYKFHIAHCDTKYELIIYHKLDDTTHVTSFGVLLN